MSVGVAFLKLLGFFVVTLKDLKQEADEFDLEGKDRTKFLKKEWRRIQDAKLEKERFEMEAEQKRLKSEAKEKRLEREREMEEKRLERKMKQKRFKKETKSQSKNLAAQLVLERLQLEEARVERENVEARAEVSFLRHT